MDTRSFGFSTGSMPYTARYLGAEGRSISQRQSPSPRALSTVGQTASPYPRSGAAGPGYANATESFPYDEPGAPAPTRIPRSNSTRPISCQVSGANNDNDSQTSGGSGGWGKDRARSPVTEGAISVEDDAAPAVKKPTAAAVSSPAAARTRTARDVGVASKSPLRKKSDWENLLGAVYLELRAQEEQVGSSGTSNSAGVAGAGVVGSSPSKRPKTDHTEHASSSNLSMYRTPLRPSCGGGGGSYSPSSSSSFYHSPTYDSASEPKHKHHRRGGAEAAGGGPAYSGSTADAACLLATLPQRMLGVSTQQQPRGVDTLAAVAAAAIGPSSANSSPSLGPVSSPAAGGPPRVQASGRRGPRGQSRFKGVCITRAGKWRAVIYIGRKQKYLGVFDSEFDAARAYDHAAVEHFAEGAKLNFPGGLKEQLEAAARAPTVQVSSPTHGGSGGAAAARAATPPPLENVEATSDEYSSSNRGQKRSYNDRYDDDEWVCDGSPWKNSRR